MENKLVLREYPIPSWNFAIFFILFALYFRMNSPQSWPVAAGAILIAVALVIFSPVVTVTADRSLGKLTILRWTLLQQRIREIQFNDLQAIQVERSIDRSGNSRSNQPTYRITAVKKDGTVIPFRSIYSSGIRSKEKKAQQLRDFIGVGGVDNSLKGLIQVASGMLQKQVVEEQRSITGSQDVEHVTAGVRWTVQTLAFGSAPVTRWHTRYFTFPRQFLYLVQKMKGQAVRAGGVLASINKMLFKQSMQMYGFTETEAPSLDYGDVLTPLHPTLEQNFSAFTSDPQTAQQILNPQMMNALAGWAEKYPLRQGSSNQLAVLIGGEGFYLAMLGHTNPEHQEELAQLGAAIVTSQA